MASPSRLHTPTLSPCHKPGSLYWFLSCTFSSAGPRPCACHLLQPSSTPMCSPQMLSQHRPHCYTWETSFRCLLGYSPWPKALWSPGGGLGAPAWTQFSCASTPDIPCGFSDLWTSRLGRVRTSHFAFPHPCGKKDTTTMARLGEKPLPKEILAPQKATVPRAKAVKHHGCCTSGHLLPSFCRPFRNTHPSCKNYFSLWRDLPPGSSAVPWPCVGFPACISWDKPWDISAKCMSINCLVYFAQKLSWPHISLSACIAPSTGSTALRLAGNAAILLIINNNTGLSPAP